MYINTKNINYLEKHHENIVLKRPLAVTQQKTMPPDFIIVLAPYSYFYLALAYHAVTSQWILN